MTDLCRKYVEEVVRVGGEVRFPDIDPAVSVRKSALGQFVTKFHVIGYGYDTAEEAVKKFAELLARE